MTFQNSNLKIKPLKVQWLHQRHCQRWGATPGIRSQFLRWRKRWSHFSDCLVVPLQCSTLTDPRENPTLPSPSPPTPRPNDTRCSARRLKERETQAEVQQAYKLQVTLSARRSRCDLSELYCNRIWLVTISDLLPIQQPSISITPTQRANAEPGVRLQVTSSLCCRATDSITCFEKMHSYSLFLQQWRSLLIRVSAAVIAAGQSFSWEWMPATCNNVPQSWQQFAQSDCRSVKAKLLLTPWSEAVASRRCKSCHIPPPPPLFSENNTARFFCCRCSVEHETGLVIHPRVSLWIMTV